MYSSVPDLLHTKGRRRLHLSRLRVAGALASHEIVRRSPTPVARAIIRAARLTLLALYPTPGNPLRRACGDIAEICRQAGYEYSTRMVYSAFACRVQYMGDAYLKAYRDGGTAVADLVEFENQGDRLLAQILEERKGLLLAVPHTLGAVFAGIGLAAAVPSCLLVKTRSLINSRALRGFLERMDVDFVLSDPTASGIQVVKESLHRLKDGQVLATAVERIDRGRDSFSATAFGQPATLSCWPARLAAQARVPVVPCFIGISRGKVRPVVEPPLESDDPAEITQRCMSFFERHLLAAPWEWAFLLDKRWRRVLAQAAAPRGDLP